MCWVRPPVLLSACAGLLVGMSGDGSSLDEQTAGLTADGREGRSLDEHTEHSLQAHSVELSPSEDSSSTTTVRRSERNRSLSLIGRESKLLELSTSLVKSISAQLIVYEEFLAEIDSLEIDILKQRICTLEKSYEVITNTYVEVCNLCENNKPPENIEKMSDHLTDDFKLTIDSATERIKYLENEEDEEAARLQEAELAILETRKQLEEELANYERIRQRKLSRAALHPQPSTSTATDPTTQTRSMVATSERTNPTINTSEQALRTTNILEGAHSTINTERSDQQLEINDSDSQLMAIRKRRPPSTPTHSSTNDEYA